MAKNFFYRINPTEVMAAAGFEADREKWFIQFFRDLMGDDPDKAGTELAAEYIREAHEFRESRAEAGRASARKRQQVLNNALQESTHVEHMLNYVEPVAVAVTEDQKILPTKKPSATPSKKKPTPGDPKHTWFVAWWCWACQQITGDTYAFSAADAGIISKLLKSPGFSQLLERACHYLLIPEEQRWPRGSPTLKVLALNINQYAGQYTNDTEIKARRLGLLPADDSPLNHYKPWQIKEAA